MSILHKHLCQYSGTCVVKQRTKLTFRRCARAVGCDLSHAAAMATEGHQAGDDGSFAEAHVAHNDGPGALTRFAGPQVILQLTEQPITAHEHRVCGDAGNLKQQRLEHDVSGLVRSKAG